MVDLIFCGGTNEDDDSDDKVSKFIGIAAWRIKFSNDNIKTVMMLQLWNIFLWSLLCFVVARSDHDKRLVRINLPLKTVAKLVSIF